MPPAGHASTVAHTAHLVHLERASKQRSVRDHDRGEPDDRSRQLGNARALDLVERLEERRRRSRARLRATLPRSTPDLCPRRAALLRGDRYRPGEIEQIRVSVIPASVVYVRRWLRRPGSEIQIRGKITFRGMADGAT